jgi:hypothetical protein
LRVSRYSSAFSHNDFACGPLGERAAAANDKEEADYLRLLATSPLVIPPSEMKSNLHSYKVLSADEEDAWNDLFSEVVQG